MDVTPLIKKLGIKPGMIISFVQAPENLFRIPGDLPEDIHVEEIGSGRLKDYIHGFYTMEKDLARDIYFLKSQLKKDGMIWISWPKGGSSVITNLNREKVREEVLKEGLVDVKVCSVDQTWSALKFVYRLKNRG